MIKSSLWRGTVAQRVRLVSGLVLFAFAATHFLNHALGLISLDAMNGFDAWRTAATRSVVGGIVLLGALLAHAGLGLWTTLRRRTWALPVWEWIQIVTGVTIPILLLPHIVNTTVASSFFGVNTTYPYELARIWTATIGQQTVLMLLVWGHGCIGLHYWLRLLPRYRTVRLVLFAVAVLVPFAAFLGISVQGRAIETVMADPAGAAALKSATHWPSAADLATIITLREDARAIYLALLGALLVVVVAGIGLAVRRRRIPVQFVGGPMVRAEPGSTLLEVSRRNNLPHVSVCGGRGRCSTCRVMVMGNGRGVSPPSDNERRTLAAIGAGPHVRLACQTRPTSDVTVLPLLKSAAGFPPRPGAGTATQNDGVERDLAVLFVDLRGFTALTERKLPFDVIYILNQFFSTVGQPVQNHGGWIANYAGDGVIALFSDEGGLDGACRSALLAAAQIDIAIETLSEHLLEETRTPLRIAMGLHAGPHVMGRVGFGASQPTSVVGLAINVASRLETLAKQHGVQLAVSKTVADHGGLDTRGLGSEPIEVRGVTEPLDIIFVEAASSLLDRLDNATVMTHMALH